MQLTDFDLDVSNDGQTEGHHWFCNLQNTYKTECDFQSVIFILKLKYKVLFKFGSPILV